MCLSMAWTGGLGVLLALKYKVMLYLLKLLSFSLSAVEVLLFSPESVQIFMVEGKY